MDLLGCKEAQDMSARPRELRLMRFWVNKFDKREVIFDNEVMGKISPKAEKKIKEIIYRFLDPKEYQVFIFGSRAVGKSKKYSDYDVGIFGKKSVPATKMVLIEEALEESDLPYKVDVVDFSLVSADFKKVALSKIKKL